MPYPVQQDSQEIARSRQVAAAVELVAVRLTQASFCLSVEPDVIKPPLRIQIRVGSRSRPRKKSSFSVEANLRLKATDASGKQAPTLELECAYLATYSLSADVDIRAIRAFSRGNAVFNCWPYFREFVQDVCGRVGLPALTLPLFKMQVVDKKRRGRHPTKSRTGAPQGRT